MLKHSETINTSLMRVSCALKACQSTLERPPSAEECNLRVFSDYNIILIGYIVYMF